MNFQSKIVQKTTGLNILNGTPACVKSGADTCDFQVRIWNHITNTSTTSGSGNLMYTQTFQDVEIGATNGIFNLVVNSCGSSSSGTSEWGTTTGSCTVVDDSDADSDAGVNFDRDDLYIEIGFADTDTSGSLGTFSELFTRIPVKSVPSAFVAQSLSGVGADGFVQLQPSAAQGATGSNSLIWLNENGGSTPNLIELEVGGSDVFLVNNTGRAGLAGAATLNAYLNLPAATTAAAQLNLATSAGTDPSSPNNGDLWWNGTNLYFYNGSGNQDLLGGSSLFTDGGTVTYLTSTTDDFAIGGTTLASSFSVDVSSNLTRLGTGSTASAVLTMYASDGDFGSITYHTNDNWIFADGSVSIGSTSARGALLVTGEQYVDYSGGGTNGGAALRIATNANQAFIGSNQYYDAAGSATVEYARTGGASYINFDTTTGATAGDIAFYTAPSGTADTTISFSNRVIFKQIGTVGIGVSSPDAWLDILAATTARAQLNLTSSAGTNPSSPVSGDLWWNGTNLYFYNGSVNVDLVGGSALFTDGGTVTYLTSITDDFAIGATNTLVAPFSVDESANTVRIGQGSGSNAILNMYASDGDTGSIAYNTSDEWAFTGGNINLTGAQVITYTTSDVASAYAVQIANNPTTTSNAANNSRGLLVQESIVVNNGVTHSGSSMSANFQNLRTSAQTGSLSNQYGLYVQYGMLSGAGGTTVNAYGARIQPYHQAGTITNSYALYIDAPAAGGTVTNQYAIYQSDTSGLNYIGGNMGIGAAALANSNLILGAATTTQSSLRINSSSGTNVSSPVSGDLWWNGTNLYFYNGSGNQDLLGGSSLFTDGGTVTYLTSTTDDFAIGGSTLTAPFSVDESTNTVRIGQGSGSNAILNMFASDGDTGSLEYVTSDGWSFNGGSIFVTKTSLGLTDLGSNWTFSHLLPNATSATPTGFFLSYDVDVATGFTNNSTATAFTLDSRIGDGTNTGNLGTLVGLSLTSGRNTTAGGNLTNSYVLRIVPSAGVGTMTTSQGIRIESTVSGATLTTNYGIFIDDQTAGTSDYGLYIAGSDTYSIWVDADDVRFDDDLIVGGNTSATETLANASFSLGGDDLFVAGSLGVEGDIFTDAGVVVGNSGLTATGTIESDGTDVFAYRTGNQAISLTEGFLYDKHQQNSAGTDNVVADQVVRKGWNFIQGNTATSITESVSFGITYEAIPTVLISYAGLSTPSSPTDLSSCTTSDSLTGSGYYVHAASTTGFTSLFRRSSTAANQYYCYTWLAIGEYSTGYGADLAENYLTYDTSLKPGDVVAINEDADISVRKSNDLGDKKVFGVVSTAPGSTLGNEDGTSEDYATFASIESKEMNQRLINNGLAKVVPVALEGRVPVKVSLENGPIKKGDYLTASSKPGFAMKAIEPGSIIGRALEDFDETTPELLQPGDAEYALIMERYKSGDISSLNELIKFDGNNGEGKIMVLVEKGFFEGDGERAISERTVNLEADQKIIVNKITYTQVFVFVSVVIIPVLIFVIVKLNSKLKYLENYKVIKKQISP